MVTLFVSIPWPSNISQPRPKPNYLENQKLLQYHMEIICGSSFLSGNLSKQLQGAKSRWPLRLSAMEGLPSAIILMFVDIFPTMCILFNTINHGINVSKSLILKILTLASEVWFFESPKQFLFILRHSFLPLSPNSHGGPWKSPPSGNVYCS